MCLATLFLEFQNLRHNRLISFSAQNKIALRARQRERKKRQKTDYREKMTESEGKREKMEKLKKGGGRGGLIAFTGTAAVLAIAVNLVITAIKHQNAKNAKKKGTPSSHLLSIRVFGVQTVKK